MIKLKSCQLCRGAAFNSRTAVALLAAVGLCGISPAAFAKKGGNGRPKVNHAGGYKFYTWSQLGGGSFDWALKADWSGGSTFPTDIGGKEFADLEVDIAGSTTVNFNQAISLTTPFHFGDSNSSHGYTFAPVGTNGLTILTGPNTIGGVFTSGDPRGSIEKVGTATDTISAKLTYSSIVSVDVASGGRLNLSGANNTFTEGLRLTAGGTLAIQGVTTVTGGVSSGDTGFSAANDVVFNGVLVDNGTLLVESILHSGSYTVDTGSSLLVSNGATDLLDASPLKLIGATFGLVDPGFTTLGLVSDSETLGTLEIADGESIIDFGDVPFTLYFANSRGVTWTGTLSIYNFTLGEDHLDFEGLGLTADQLDDIIFYSDEGETSLGVAHVEPRGGDVEVVPEPSSIVLGGMGLVGLALRRNRRKQQLA